jgi:hypothetical protein
VERWLGGPYAGIQPEDMGDLPPGWTALLSMDIFPGREYFVDLRTLRSQWRRPVLQHVRYSDSGTQTYFGKMEGTIPLGTAVPL